MPPDAGAAGEARGGRGCKWPPAGTVAGDWAEMRVLQWFRGARPHSFLSLTTVKWLIFLRGLRESGSFFCGRPIDMFGNIVYYIRKIEERYGF